LQIFKTDWLQKHVESRRIDRVRYLDLYSPALDWVLECIAYRGDQALFEVPSPLIYPFPFSFMYFLSNNDFEPFPSFSQVLSF
jgi:hypothetical protein